MQGAIAPRALIFAQSALRRPPHLRYDAAMTPVFNLSDHVRLPQRFQRQDRSVLARLR